MGKFKLTENQAAAVNNKNGTLLVAAAAGSGKTAILTQRLLQRLCSPNEEGDISEFLVVTYTKAATAELKERLYKELSAYVAEHPENKRARRQLSLIGLAKISTIHSFCLDIIKENFQALSLPPKLRMGEETEISVLMQSTLEELITEKYEETDNNTTFLKAVEIFSNSKSDENFMQTLLSLYKKLRSISEPWKKYLAYLDKYTEAENCTEIFQTEYGKLIQQDLKDEITRTLAELNDLLLQTDLDEAISLSLRGAIETDCESLEKIKNSLDIGYLAAKNAADGFSSTRAKPIKNCENTELLLQIREYRTKCCTRVKNALKRYLGASEEIFKISAKESKEVLTEIYSILKEFNSRFSARKLEKGLLDFADLEQYALTLLVKNTGKFGTTFQRTDLAKSISANYREIYIDEYQDTNQVQDMIFRAVASYDSQKGTEINRFLVGDVKQSVYRFRGTQPEIFSSYISRFPNLKDDSEQNQTVHKIYLSNNFRCSQNVINATNTVFFKIMDGYTSEDSLIYSKGEQSKVNSPCELVVLNTDDKNQNQSAEKFSPEALYAAARIKQMVQNPDYLNEDGNMYAYSDFAILSRSANSLAEDYRRAFRYAGIPLACDAPDNFFEKSEVLLAMCLLQCVDNPQRDIYTAGLMYSPLFEFTADELVQIRSRKKSCSFYSSVQAYAEENPNDAIGQKASNFIKKINQYRTLSRGTPTDELISLMFEDIGIYNIYKNENARKSKNIRKIHEFARNFEKTSFRGLSTFLDYLNDLKSSAFGSRTADDSNSVKLMSIHRSKGLEFPVVILTGALKDFNLTDEKEPIIFNETYGIGIKLRDTFDTELTQTKRNISSINTPFRESLRSIERSLMLEEEKRLLYVAMTRARDRLIICAATKDINRTQTNAEHCRNTVLGSFGKYAINYFDFICPALSDEEFSGLWNSEKSDCKGSIKCYKVDLSHEYFNTALNTATKQTILPQPNQEVISKYTAELKIAKESTVYKSSLSGISAKLSVSQLKKGLLDAEETVEMTPKLKKYPNFMQNNSTVDYAERGTAIHIFMQFANYANIENNGVSAEATRLLNKGFITNRMYEILDLEAIENFIKSNFYKKIKAAPKLYRERRFNLKLSASEFTQSDNPRLKNEFILVQGVTDIYFEEKDGSIILADFKTDRVTPQNGEDILRSRHSEQLKYYKRAVEEITGKQVSKVYIYSFALSKEILLDI